MLLLPKQLSVRADQRDKESSGVIYNFSSSVGVGSCCWNIIYSGKKKKDKGRRG